MGCIHFIGWWKVFCVNPIYIVCYVKSRKFILSSASSSIFNFGFSLLIYSCYCLNYLFSPLHMPNTYLYLSVNVVLWCCCWWWWFHISVDIICCAGLEYVIFIWGCWHISIINSGNIAICTYRLHNLDVSCSVLL